MGKYVKKSKIAGALSVKDVSHQTTSGFRTRAAKNLALQRLRSHNTPPSFDADSYHYLQLRSRRLVKLPLLADTRKKQQNRRANSEKPESDTSKPKEDCGSNLVKTGSDCSFGEECSEFESGDRETTCSLRRDSEEATQRVPSSEIEDFFAFAEQQQQRHFTEKYNFDIVSENPLPGRYEWIKVVP